MRQQPDEIDATILETLSYLRCGNIVATLGHPAPHTVDMQVDVGETREPDVHEGACPRRLLEQRSHRLAAERRFKGEIGVLKYTLANATSEKCFLVIEYDHIPYVGCLLCSDLAFSTQLASILHTQSGRTIQEIGDLDLDFTL